MRYFHFYCKYAKWGLWDEYAAFSDGITPAELDQQLEEYVAKHYKPRPSSVNESTFDLMEDAIFHAEYDEITKEEYDSI